MLLVLKHEGFLICARIESDEPHGLFSRFDDRECFPHVLLLFFFPFPSFMIIIVHHPQYLEVCLKSHFAPVSVTACLSCETTVSPSKGEGVPGPPHCPQACLRQVIYSHQDSLQVMSQNETFSIFRVPSPPKRRGCARSRTPVL